MQKRHLSYKLSRILRSSRIKPILFIIPFVILAGIIYLYLSQAATETKFQLFSPGWRGLGPSGSDSAVNFPEIFGSHSPEGIRAKNANGKTYNYTLGPYVTAPFVPCDLIPTENPHKSKCGGPGVLPASAIAKDANGKAVYANNFTNNFLVVPDDPAWVNYLKNIKTPADIKFNNSSTNLFDGILTDSMGTGAVASGYLNNRPFNPKTGKEYTKAEWLQAETAMMSAKRAGLQAGKLLIMNGLASGDQYWEEKNNSPRALLEHKESDGKRTLDGAMAESIFRNAGDSLNNWPTTESWLKDVTMIEDVEKTYNMKGYWWSKCWSGAIGTDPNEKNVTCDNDETVTDAAQRVALKKQWLRFTMASYLLGAGPNSYFNWDTNKNDNNAAEYFAEYDKAKALGTTTDSKIKIGNLYKRSFSKGVVVVNPTNEAQNFTLPAGNHTNLDGSTKTGTVSVPAHSGEIFLAVSGGSGSSGALKSQISGLVDPFGSPAPEAYQGVVNGFIVKVNWKALQPNAGGEIAANNAIDNAIATARSKNLKLKVRLMGGVNAPDWAKQIGGSENPSDLGPVITVHDSGSGSGPVGRFWLDAYGVAYQDLQNKLAAKYDNTPELVDITISRCMTIYAEPFLRESFGDANAENRTAYKNAGYTLAADAKCQRDQIDAHKVWNKTRSSLAFNPYQKVNDDGTDGGNDEAFTETMIDYCRSSLGARCVLGNNSISVPWVGTNGDCSSTDTNTTPIHRMYCKIKSMGGPIYLQAAHPSNRDSYDFEATLEKAISYGAGMVELPQGYQTSGSAVYRTPSQLTSFDSQLEANATGGSGGTGPSAVNSAGIWMVWGNTAIAQKPFVKGVQIVGEWVEVETAKGVFDWSKLGSSQRGFAKNYIDPTATPYVNKPFTIQVNSTKKPCSTSDPGCVDSDNDGTADSNRWWGYKSSEVKWCGLFTSRQTEGGGFAQDVPLFWNTAGTGLNDTYKSYLEGLVGGLKTELNTSKYNKDRILGVRASPNLIGTEHKSLLENGVNQDTVPSNCKDSWKSSAANSSYAQSMNMYKDNFEGSGIKPIYRAEYWNTSPPNQELFFLTNASPDTKNQYSSEDPFYLHARKGPYRAYYEPFNESSHYSNPVSWNWWLILEQLSRGVNYIAVYGNDLTKASTDSCPTNVVGTTGDSAKEYQMAYCFANKYAPYANAQNTAGQAQASPGAWVAFTRADHSQGSTGYIGMYLNGNGITDSNSSQANIAIADQVTVGSKTYNNNSDPVPAIGNMGNLTQRYARYARSISSTQSLAMSLDANFKNSLANTLPTVNVTYLDTGSGTITMRWGNVNKTFNKTNSGNWVTGTVTLAAKVLPSSGNDITLTSSDNTTFHMVEVLRGEPDSGCTGDCTAPIVSVTSPAAGATVNGTFNVTASASDNIAVTKVEFFADGSSTAFCSDTTAPYSCGWNTTAIANGPHTLIAKAYDSVTSTTSGSVSVTISNTPPDTQAPTITISAPANGSKVSGSSVAVSANATDNVGVTSVVFKIDGTTAASDTTAPYGFSWDSKAANNSTHSLTATAYDAAGKNTTATINFTVENTTAPPLDTIKPTVGISSPANGATAKGSLIINVNASDNVGVAKVELYIDGISAGTDSLAPYVFSWDTENEKNGNHTLTARAYDTSNNDELSDVINIAVTNAKDPGSKKADANGDNKVNWKDLSTLASHWLKTSMTLAQGDFNGDGLVNYIDLSILASNWEGGS